MERLVAAAISARDNAYAPYSNYKVGAALLTKQGKIYTGCNVENASYGASICAERTAVVKAVSEGETEFEAIAIVTDDSSLGSPCGICRQFLAEFGTDIKLIIANLNGAKVESTLQEYLPHAFGPDYLK